MLLAKVLGRALSTLYLVHCCNSGVGVAVVENGLVFIKTMTSNLYEKMNDEIVFQGSNYPFPAVDFTRTETTVDIVKLIFIDYVQKHE
jgi:hypothetical protein